jgi:hypothetical protein
MLFICNLPREYSARDLLSILSARPISVAIKHSGLFLPEVLLFYRLFISIRVTRIITAIRSAKSATMVSSSLSRQGRD